MGYIPGPYSGCYCIQRIDVLLYDILWSESAVYMGTLGAKYLIYGYLDPLGKDMSRKGTAIYNPYRGALNFDP